MPISLTCQCGKEYQLSDTLAGKKGRCKACGAVFQIPEAAATTPRVAAKPAPVTAPKPAPAQPAAVDLFSGLDDGETVARTKTSTRAAAAKFGHDEPEEDAPAPRTRSGRVKQRKKVDEEAKAKYRGSGISMLVFGGLAFALPMVGVQFKILNFMPPAVQILIASGLIIMGLTSLAISALAAPPRWLGPVAFLSIVGVAVLGGVFLSMLPRPNGPGFQTDLPRQRVVMPQRPNVTIPPPQVQLPQPIPQPSFPQANIPQPSFPQASIPQPGMPPTSTGPNYPGQDSNVANGSNPPGFGPPGFRRGPMMPPQMGPRMGRPPGFPNIPRPNFPGQPNGQPGG